MLHDQNRVKIQRHHQGCHLNSAKCSNARKENCDTISLIELMNLKLNPQKKR